MKYVINLRTALKPHFKVEPRIETTTPMFLGRNATFRSGHDSRGADVGSGLKENKEDSPGVSDRKLGSV